MIHFTILAVLIFCTRLAVSQSPATFWNGYPSCAVNECLVPITESTGCEINDNECVCTTASFVTSVAACLGQKCPAIVYSIYQTYAGACKDGGGYSVAITAAQWEAAANAASSPSSSPSQSTVIQGTTLETATSTRPVQQPSSSSNANIVQPAATTETQPVVTDTAPSPGSSSTSSSSTSGGLTLDQKIALGVGIGIGVPSFLVALIGVAHKLCG